MNGHFSRYLFSWNLVHKVTETLLCNLGLSGLFELSDQDLLSDVVHQLGLFRQVFLFLLVLVLPRLLAASHLR